jgi:fatty-acyl-CoA synthase
VRGGRVAAVGLANAEVGTEDIALIVETTEREAEARERIRFDVESRVHRATGLRPDRVVLVPPNTIPVTTSGKVRRALARQELLRRLAG